jgi:hypothetical protein
MTERSGVFLLQGEDSLVAMEPGEFATEDDFQKLLSRFPALLVGDQIDPLAPRRWVLVKREQSISTGEAGASVWSIDHVFLDQDGIPTLVEIKRQSDSRIGREVVGQMLDYAANCVTYWSAESLQAGFEATCREADQSSDAVLRELIGDDETVEHFWLQVQRNLQAKNLRLLFVADVIPLELRRIVEFLNDQMNPTGVLAIELRQFVSGGLRTIVPTVYGQSQIGSAKRASVGRRWDEATFFEKLSQAAGEPEINIARQIYEWMGRGGKRALQFGTGKENGSVYPIFRPKGTTINPVYLSSDGKVWVQFGSLANKPIFGSLEARRALMQHFNEIDGVNFTDADMAKYRAIPLGTIAKDSVGPAKMIRALEWMEQEIERA